MSVLGALYPAEYVKELRARGLIKPFVHPLPITYGTKREVVQDFLPYEMKGINITRRVNKLDREIADNFDLDKALAEALEQRAKAGLP